MRFLSYVKALLHNLRFNRVNLYNIVIPENFVADAEKFIRNPGVGDMNMNYS